MVIEFSEDTPRVLTVLVEYMHQLSYFPFADISKEKNNITHPYQTITIREFETE